MCMIQLHLSILLFDELIVELIHKKRLLLFISREKVKFCVYSVLLYHEIWWNNTEFLSISPTNCHDQNRNDLWNFILTKNSNILTRKILHVNTIDYEWLLKSAIHSIRQKSFSNAFTIWENSKIMLSTCLIFDIY
jgi:hypothetical protein